MSKLLSLGWTRRATLITTAVIAVVLLAALSANAAQPMRLPAGTHDLRPDATGIARLPASCTRQDLPAPKRDTTLSIHNDGVQVVRNDNGVAQPPIPYAKAVDNGWVDWPAGDEIAGEGSPYSITINIKQRPAGTSYQVIVGGDKPALFGDDRTLFDETLPIVESYRKLTGPLDEQKVRAGVPVGGWESADDLPSDVRLSASLEWQHAFEAKERTIRDRLSAGALRSGVKRLDFRPGAPLRIEGDAVVVQPLAGIDSLFEVTQVIDLLERTPQLIDVARRLPSLSYAQLRQREQILNRVTVRLVSVDGKPELQKDGLSNLSLAGAIPNIPEEWLAVLRRGLLNVDMTDLPANTSADFRRIIVPQKLALLEVRVKRPLPDFDWILSEDRDAAARLDRLWQEPPSPIAVTVDASSIRSGDDGKASVNNRVANVLERFAKWYTEGNVRVFYGDASSEVFDNWIKEVEEHGTLGGKKVAGVRFVVGSCLHNADQIDRMVKALQAKGAEGCVAPTKVVFGTSLALVTDVLIEHQANLGVLARRSLVNAQYEALRRIQELELDPTPLKARGLFPRAYQVLLNESDAVDVRLVSEIKIQLADPEMSHSGSAEASGQLSSGHSTRS